MKMQPAQFTMWLRGVLDGHGEGVALPAEVAKTVYEQLSEVVAGQVADRLADAWRDELKPVESMKWPQGQIWGGGGAVPVPYTTIASDEVALQIAQLRCQTDMEIAKMKA